MDSAHRARIWRISSIRSSAEQQSSRDPLTVKGLLFFLSRSYACAFWESSWYSLIPISAARPFPCCVMVRAVLPRLTPSTKRLNCFLASLTLRFFAATIALLIFCTKILYHCLTEAVKAWGGAEGDDGKESTSATLERIDPLCVSYPAFPDPDSNDDSTSPLSPSRLLSKLPRGSRCTLTLCRDI